MNLIKIIILQLFLSQFTVVNLCKLETVACTPILDFYKANVAPLNVDDGGTWTIVSLPTGSTLTQGDLAGDNPCLDFNIFGCGQYILNYSYSSSTCDGCEKNADVVFIKCCLEINPICN